MIPAPKPETFRDPAYIKWIGRKPCLVCARMGDVDAAHVKTKRVYGDAWVVPLCRSHHVEQHAIGIVSFAKRYELDLINEARLYKQWYDQRAA